MVARTPDLRTLQQDDKTCLAQVTLPVYRAFHVLAQEKYAARGHPGLTTAHTLLFTHLDAEGTRIVTLAERMGTSKQFTGRLVHQLVELSYMTAEPDPQDRRATIVRATPRGIEFFNDACAAKDEIEAMFRAVVGKADYDQMIRSMAKLAAHFAAQGRTGSLHPLGDDHTSA